MNFMQRLVSGPAFNLAAEGTPAPTPGLMAFVAGHFPYRATVQGGIGNIRGPIPQTGVPYSYGTRMYKGILPGDFSFFGQDVSQAPVPQMSQAIMRTVS